MGSSHLARESETEPVYGCRGQTRTSRKFRNISGYGSHDLLSLSDECDQNYNVSIYTPEPLQRDCFLDNVVLVAVRPLTNRIIMKHH